MPKMNSPASLLDVLKDFVDWLRKTGVPGVLIGGVAASILGRPRMTQDIDALILLEEEKWDDFLSGGERFGFVPRLTDCLDFAKKSRVLLVRHKPSGIDVDVTLGILPFEKETVSRAVWIDLKKVRLLLPTAEDLIVMKAFAHRPKDLSDIESILDAHPKLNFRRVRRFVRAFSEAVDMPEILNDLESILARKRGQP